MDINRLRKLAGMINESAQFDEDTRKMTNELHRMMDEGEIDPRTVADAALIYMSEDEVADMMHSNEMMPYDSYDDEDEDEDPDYFDDLDAGDTEMDRRSDLRRGW